MVHIYFLVFNFAFINNIRIDNSKIKVYNYLNIQFVFINFCYDLLNYTSIFYFYKKNITPSVHDLKTQKFWHIV